MRLVESEPLQPWNDPFQATLLEKHVISVEGNVSESQDGQSWSKADAATILEPQDWLKTDRSGMATLLLPDSTQTKIGPNTKIKLIGPPDLKQSSSIALNISSGKVWSQQAK